MLYSVTVKKLACTLSKRGSVCLVYVFYILEIIKGVNVSYNHFLMSQYNQSPQSLSSIASADDAT